MLILIYLLYCVTSGLRIPFLQAFHGGHCGFFCNEYCIGGKSVAALCMNCIHPSIGKTVVPNLFHLATPFGNMTKVLGPSH